MFYLNVMFSLILVMVLLFTIWMLSFPGVSSFEKNTPFECGFDPLSNMRAPFSTRFFLLVVLFLIFDVEVALLFPILSVLASSSTVPLMISLFLFLVILLVGMFHEWNEGALDWVSA
uniref:NADH-ubiquinone oxidoreductase chain 3 n=1 Tax=Micromelo undatus TaxID=340426 RepID=E6Y189_MICUD|nr:NADH dehydrogenase subunit 3 [Micromelo undatus]ABK92262.1 NADH dehydrogenase subunit 3 [Micromelo undatus]